MWVISIDIYHINIKTGNFLNIYFKIKISPLNVNINIYICKIITFSKTKNFSVRRAALFLSFYKSPLMFSFMDCKYILTSPAFNLL